MRAPFAIAIDGPAASGKSSVASELARRLGVAFVSTGVMYRAVAWYALRRGIDLENGGSVAAAAERARIETGFEGDGIWLRIDGEDPMPHLRAPEISGNVSSVARVPQVREKLIALQRELGRQRPVVMEGRDIGTVVLADTPWKYFLEAPLEVRRQRRAAQGEAEEIGRRDLLDSGQMAVASDAVRIDTSRLTLPEVVQAVLDDLARRGGPGLAATA